MTVPCSFVQQAIIGHLLWASRWYRDSTGYWDSDDQELLKKHQAWDFPRGPVANVEGPDSIPGQGTRSHMWQLKSSHATTKTWCSQINILKKEWNIQVWLHMDWIHLTHFQGFVWCPSLLVGFPDSSVGKAPTCKAGDPSSIPGPGRSAGEGIGLFLGFPSGSAGKDSACLCSSAALDPWVGKIPWRRERLPTPVFWPGEFHGLYSPWGRKESNPTSNFHFQFSWSPPSPS